MWGEAPPGRLDLLDSELTGFVGRRAELAGVREALGGARLVTLTGPGGIGKTRLAVRAAAQLRRGFRDGAWVAELAGLHDSALLATEVARALGMIDQSPRWGVAALAERLAGRQLLLVVDNCEHLRDACAVLAGALLRACGGLRILATSREVLGVSGEVTLPVPPLQVPGEGGAAERLLGYEAVRLFAERGAAVLPGFTVDAGNAAAVAELCRRLEGIPLAIELAAVRLRSMAPSQILARLEDRFGLLSLGDQATPRHGTLQAALTWSYDLMSEAERVLWARCSVFTGPFDLDAAEVVCAGDGIPADAMADLVDALVAKSVLLRRPGGRAARYDLLDTIREYGLRRLREAGQEKVLRCRHRDWYAAMAARPEALGARQIEWIDGLDTYHDNVRAALEFSLSEPVEVAAGLRMACALWLYWETRGHLTEGRRLLDLLLGCAGGAIPGLRARGMWVAGYLALVQGDGPAARSLLEAALIAARAAADEPAADYATQFLGRAAWFTGEPDRGLALTSQALQRHRAAADWQGTVLTLVQLGVMRTLTGQPEAAVAPLKECAAECDARGERWNRSYALWGLGLAAWLLGDNGSAAELEQASLRLKRDIGDQVGIALCLEALAWIAASRGQAARAADLLGAATAAWSSIPAVLPEPLIRHRKDAERQARDRLGETSFTAHLRKAQALPPARAVAAALGEQPRATQRAGAASEPTELSARERQVAALVAEGLSNREIAVRLVISARTAETHVQHILVKLGLTARAQIAAWSATGPGAGPSA